MNQQAQFQLDDDYIELFKLLKVMGIADTGGMAKLLIDEGYVLVNGQLEQRKRRKLVVGDYVEIQDVSIELTE